MLRIFARRLTQSLLPVLGIAAAVVTLGACSLRHDYSNANGVQGTGYPVDHRDKITSYDKPLNGEKVGGP